MRSRVGLALFGASALVLGAAIALIATSGGSDEQAATTRARVKTIVGAPVFERANPRLTIRCRGTVCRQGRGVRVAAVRVGQSCQLAQDPGGAVTGRWVGQAPGAFICHGVDGTGCAVANSAGAVFHGRWRGLTCALPQIAQQPCALTSSGRATDPPPSLGTWVELVFSAPGGGTQRAFRCQ
jgi:hypothetical protein